ncbi:MAG: YgaP-like transmembrane domain [Planctomycetaceae bacterium]|nr:DUF2892 domain-containing protein [Planctomycetaceae bacterium]
MPAKRATTQRQPDAGTAERVQEHSPEEVNEMIREQIRARVRSLSHEIETIDRRLSQIDREWDIERTLEANAAVVLLLGVLLSLRRRWLAVLPLAVGGFLLQHAVQGWCPPVELFRRAGVRTMKEIDAERYALKALRGDFKDADQGQPMERAEAALQAATY